MLMTMPCSTIFTLACFVGKKYIQHSFHISIARTVKVEQWFPNFFGLRTTKKNSVVREGQNIDLCRDSRTTSANLTDHQWSAEQTLGITEVECAGAGLN